LKKYLKKKWKKLTKCGMELLYMSATRLLFLKDFVKETFL